MKRTTFKYLCLGVAAIGLVGLSHNANAQTATVQADLVTNSAVTATTVDAMDFGEWLLVHGGAGTGTLTLSDDGSVTVTPNTATAPGSAFVEITPGLTEGLVNVQGPAAGVLTMTRSGTVDFPSPALLLSNVSYRTATENGNIAADSSFGPVTLTAAGVDEPVVFGGQIAVTATPADGTHNATFDVTFSY